MSCDSVLQRLSPYLDDDLGACEARDVAAHLETCAGCDARWRSLRASVQALRELPALRPAEPLAARVMARLEVESRGPGLALLFRPAWTSRPLILPSLLPAALVFLCALGGAVLLDSVPRRLLEAFGVPGDSELPPVALVGMDAPRLEAPALADDFVPAREDSHFFRTVVTSDGRVSRVTLLDGQAADAGRLMNALQRERFEPAHYRGQAVAVSVYRLISRLDVHAPET